MRAKLKEIIEQLEACNYECKAGSLENNIAFRDLKALAYPDVHLIEGVQVKFLTRHRDERGYFQEIIRVTDDFFAEGFGQWSMSFMYPQTVKAWHWHKFQCDFWFVALGELKAVLYDLRKDSPTYGLTNEFMMGDGREPFVLKIPPGVAHGLKTLTPVYFFYITSRVYDPADEGRIPYDDPGIGYDWLKGPEIK